MLDLAWSKRIGVIMGALLAALCFAERGAAEDVYEEMAVQKQRLEAEALNILAQRIGVWDSRWEFMADDGAISRVLEGTEVSEFILDDRVVQGITTIPEINTVGRSLNYFHPVEGKLYFFSVNKTGDHWILTEEVGSGMMISHRHRQADGVERIIRFKTIRRTESEVDVLREDSVDGGATWAPVFMQYLKKRSN